MPRAYVYIDGFNLYYRMLEKRPGLKWLNLESWCRSLLPNHDIDRIRYFTAHVKAWPNDLSKPQRQQAYLRALRTTPLVSVHLGRFKKREKRMWLKHPQPGGPRTADVVYYEEKRSDVNLASYMVLDGFRKLYDLAVLISDDSDLRLPIEIVMNELGLTVWVFNPQQGVASELRSVATQYRVLRVGPLQGHQFPNVLTDAIGQFGKPASWV